MDNCCRRPPPCHAALKRYRGTPPHSPSQVPQAEAWAPTPHHRAHSAPTQGQGMLQEGRLQQPWSDRTLLPGDLHMTSQQHTWPQGYSEGAWGMGGADLGGSLLDPSEAASWKHVQSQPHLGSAPGGGLRAGAGAGTGTQEQFCGASVAGKTLLCCQLPCLVIMILANQPCLLQCPRSFQILLALSLLCMQQQLLSAFQLGLLRSM